MPLRFSYAKTTVIAFLRHVAVMAVSPSRRQNLGVRRPLDTVLYQDQVTNNSLV